MKNEKGITLGSLVIYIIAFTLTLALLAMMSNYIYGNIKNISNEKTNLEEFNKFNTSFVADIKQSDNAIIENKDIGTDEEEISIQLSNGEVYTWIKKDNSIYKNKFKIAKNILDFSAEKIEESNPKRKILQIDITTNYSSESSKFEKQIDYVLKYW